MNSKYVDILVLNETRLDDNVDITEHQVDGLQLSPNTVIETVAV